MNNMRTYTQFINEGRSPGFFSMFKSKKEKKYKSKKEENKDLPKSETFLKLMKVINEMDPRLITKIGNEQYSFTKKFHEPTEDDPHDEEVYDDDITIYIDWYGVYINKDKLPMHFGEYNILKNTLELKYKNQQKHERDMRIKNALDKI